MEKTEVITFKQAVDDLIVDVMHDKESHEYLFTAATEEVSDIFAEDYAIPVVSQFLGWLKVYDEHKFKNLMSNIFDEYHILRELNISKDEALVRRSKFKIIK